VKNSRYVVVTPARDEEEHLASTIQAMADQSCRPHPWIIVNDGSTDRTAEIADRASRDHPWIQTVHREDRGCRKPGGGVIDAFYDGYELVSTGDWDFIVKLDADLSFEADYFESCFDRFRHEPDLGIGGGMVCSRIGEEMRKEGTHDPSFHVRGATKIYRRDCWFAIGELLRAPGWDTLDEIKANMLGWKTHPFPDLVLVQHRPTGGAEGSWKDAEKNGRANYIAGYHPLFMIAKCLKRLPRRPVVRQSVALFWGYFGAWLRGVRRVDDPELIAYLRKQQVRRLLFRDSLWS